MGKRAERSKITYDKMAVGYDTSPEGNYTRPHKAELIKQVAVRDGDSILDVACGNGTLLDALSKKASVHAFGVDLSENMIAAARERHPDCTFAVCSCVPLSFENESMDVITVSCAFHHFEDPRAFAGECMRVLKKNEMVYMAEPFFTPVIRWLANTVVFPFSKSGDVKVYSERELRGIFEVTGFRDIRTYTKGTVLFFPAKNNGNGGLLMNEMLKFSNRAEFRAWLAEHCATSGGVWLLFGKAGGPKTITANNALEEALCFGWIDGQMQSLDDKTYQKHFSQRRENSKWSEKNKARTEKLEQQGIMTDHGREKIAEAKRNGQWNVVKAPAVTDEQIDAVAELLRGYEPAYTNFQAMPPSVKKTYTRAYLDVKTEDGREKWLAWMVDRLHQNLKPM